MNNSVLILYWKPTEEKSTGAIQKISIFTEVTCILKPTKAPLEWTVRYLSICRYTCIISILLAEYCNEEHDGCNVLYDIYNLRTFYPYVTTRTITSTTHIKICIHVCSLKIICIL